MSLREDKVNLVVTINGDPARRELVGLEKKAFDIRDSLKDLKKGTQEYIDANKKLKDVQDQMDKVRGSIDLNNKTIKELNAEVRQLSAIRQILVPGTEAFKKNEDQLKATKQRLYELNQEVKVGEGFWSKLRGQAAQFGALAAGYLGIQALIGKVQGLFQANYKLSDSYANVMKTTGLTQLQVEELSKAFGKMDTRTSREDLFKLATEAGKLGKDSVESVKKFVEQADKIKVALGEDLGDDAIISIGKLSKIFKTEMLNIASAINSIGQASEASEQYQVDFLNRLAGVSQTAKLSAPDLLGYSAALEINGQDAEKSGTALTKFFIDFVKDTEKYGKAAGFMKGELTKLIGDKGTNAAFLEFLTRLKIGSSSAQDLLLKMEDLGIDGARGAGIFLTLSNNIGLVNAQQKLANDSFTKGTSVIDEFNVRNENFAATIDKLQKRFASWFSGGEIMNGLKTFVNLLAEAFDPRSAVEKSADAWKKSTVAIQDYDASVGPLVQRYEDLKSKTTLTKDEQEELKKVIKAIGDYVPTAITEFGKYGEALGINTDKVNAYRAALVSMNQIKNKDALNEAAHAMGEVSNEIDKINRALNTRDSEGNIIKTIGSMGTVSTIRLTNEEINKLRASLGDKQLELEGHKNIVNELTGITVYATQATKAINALSAGSGSGSDDTKLTGGGSGEDSERSKELKKLQKELDDLVGKIKEVDKQFANSKLNSDGQAFQGIRDRYQPLIDQARGHENTNDPNAAKYKEERIHLEEQLQKELDAKKEEFRQRDLVAEQKAQDEIFTATSTDNDREVNAEADKWDRLIQLADKYGIDSTVLTTSKNDAIDAINKKHALKEQKDADDQRKKIHAIQLKRIKDTRDVTDAVSDVFTNMFDYLGNEESQYTELQKELAIIKLGIDTATSISSAIANASTLPPPASFIAYASSIAQIFAAMSTAKKYLSATPDPKKLEDGGAVIPDGPSHSQGGLQIVDSRSSRVVAESEGGELHVFSKKFVQNNRGLVDAIMDASNNNNGILRRPIWMDAQPRVINMPLVNRANRFHQFENGGQILEFMPGQSEKGLNPHIRTGRAVVNSDVQDLIKSNTEVMLRLVKHLDDGIPTYMLNDKFDIARKDWDLKKKGSLMAS